MAALAVELAPAAGARGRRFQDGRPEPQADGHDELIRPDMVPGGRAEDPHPGMVRARVSEVVEQMQPGPILLALEFGVDAIQADPRH